MGGKRGSLGGSCVWMRGTGEARGAREFAVRGKKTWNGLRGKCGPGPRGEGTPSVGARSSLDNCLVPASCSADRRRTSISVGSSPRDVSTTTGYDGGGVQGVSIDSLGLISSEAMGGEGRNDKLWGGMVQMN